MEVVCGKTIKINLRLWRNSLFSLDNKPDSADHCRSGNRMRHAIKSSGDGELQ
jgi:hypothetical protein